VFLFFSSVVDPAASQTAPTMSEADRVQFGRDTLALAFELLRTRGVPFDPELLIDRDWRSELAPALELMPEMRETLHVTGRMNGVYIADTVLLGDHVTLAGDTFILVRDFGTDDENAVINIAGPHSLFIYVIGDLKKNAAMMRSAGRGMPPMRLHIDAMAPSVIVGIPPRYIGRQSYRGRPGYSATGIHGGPLMPTTDITPSGIPHLLDPDFEAFRIVRDPLSGWCAGDDAGVTITPDSTIKAQGKYSLRLEQARKRSKQEAQAFLEQVVRLPKDAALTRDFDLSVQTRGASNGRAIMEIYVREIGHSARAISRKEIKIQKDWTTTRTRFSVPDGLDQFGVRFYLPLTEAAVWLDDVRLAPALKTRP
jgi:hypothetical protein